VWEPEEVLQRDKRLDHALRVRLRAYLDKAEITTDLAMDAEVLVCDEARFACARMIANVIMKMIQTRRRELMTRSPVGC
jgi:hypothetical protein